VNISKIRFIQDEHRLHFITLDDDSIRPIPLSKSYYESILASLNTMKSWKEKVNTITDSNIEA
jgi:hypothetical protein